jgi:DNA-binding transcriptional MerR regulator
MSRPTSDAARGDLPPKLYFRIGEVAELVGVEPHVLRYWEREFRSIRPTKSAKGQRVYSRRDVENLMRVRQLLYSEGFTIAGAKKKLQRPGVDADGETRGEVAAEAEAEVRTSTGADASKTRDQLLAMRREIEAFLGELGAPRR